MIWEQFGSVGEQGEAKRAARLARAKLHDALWLQSPIYNQFGIEPSKGFGHMTVPANWAMSGKHFRELFGTELSPLD